VKPAPSRSLIPQFEGSISLRKTFRFQATSGVVSESLLGSDFLYCLVIGLNGSTTVRTLLSAMRIHRVDIYDLSGSTDVAVSTIRWSWLSSQGPAIDTVVSGTPIYPGSLSSSPPAKSLASDWIGLGTSLSTEFAQVTIPIGSILDLTVSVVFNSYSTSGVSITSPVTLAPGEIRLMRLDTSGSGFLQGLSLAGV
jgi:hypothetical protein